ncbi:probable E3 ubiquitin-protein ligase HERC3 isoform X2 [Papaver somniferum]|uniref:probable E3 ubiquitin-protein ligase HERC3 isoform X2 n=1 Tax=Papaver somniferum TaxID=3469 RepID=UPI000E6F4843|nr:probable E3 ubiquitin-protein ligase HERC3 isoform X2 [Papaver somniferum]
MKGTMLAGVRWLLKHNNNSKKFRLNASSSVAGGIGRSCYDCIPNIRTFSSSSSVREGCDDGVGGYVMSFGDGNQGALGLPSSSMGIGAGGGGDAYEPTKITGLPSDDITCIGAGHYHSLSVTSHGDVWSWGRNNEFQLGRDSFDVPRDSWSKPEMVQGLSQVRVKAVYASGVVSTAIGEDGSLWVWGKSRRGQLGLGKGITDSPLPSRVEALAGEHIVKVSLGWGHTLALTNDGRLFGWGYSADGRLGHIGMSLENMSMSPQILGASTLVETQGTTSSLEVAEKLVLEQMQKENDMPIIWEPCLLQELNGVQVSDVACGLDHSLVLCCNGVLLSGGNNTYGQLGRGKEDSSGLSPVDMSFQPLSISSGLGHSLAVCQQISSSQEVMGGDVSGTGIASWGWNGNSQLGRSGPENVPKLVEGLEEETPLFVSGGRVHSVALTSKGGVWVWGCGKNGRLGLGSSIDEVEPALIEDLEGVKVLQIASGFDHNLLLVVNQ